MPSAGGAQTQTREPRAEGSLFGSAFFGGPLAQGTNALFDVPVNLADDTTWGWRVAFKLTSRLELGVHASTASTSFVDPNRSLLFGGGDERSLGDVEVSYLLGYASVRLGQRRSVPYLTFGAGIKWFLAPRVGLRVDCHYFATWLSIPECPSSFRCDKNRWLSNGDATGIVVALF